METRETLLQKLNETVSQLLATCQTLTDPDRLVYERWSAKDVLAHLTFWHESFARNVRDLAQGITPTPLKGRLSDLNQQGVDEMRSLTLAQVSDRLATAQALIQEHVLTPKLTSIPYRKGSREYSPEEHLEIVIGHIQLHLRDVRSTG